jgi:hypothetical protein
MTAPYNVLKKEAAGAMIWIEAVLDLESEKALAINLSRYNEGEFLVFDQHEQQVVASYQGRPTVPPPQNANSWPSR